MQFLLLPQWSSEWCVPAFTSFTATGGGTAPKAWTSTTPSTAKPQESQRRMRFTSVGLTGSLAITTLTPGPWSAWHQSVRGRVHHSSLCLWGPVYQTLPHTGTQSSPPSLVLSESEDDSRNTVTAGSRTDTWLPSYAGTEWHLASWIILNMPGFWSMLECKRRGDY